VGKDLKATWEMDTWMSGCGSKVFPGQLEQPELYICNPGNSNVANRCRFTTGQKVKAIEQRMANKDKKHVQNTNFLGKYIKMSILDMTTEDLEHLVTIRENVMEKLQQKYNVDLETDDVRVYFHWPYTRDTATLHMHIRVNTPFHPAEQARSIRLDDMIEYLEMGKSLDALIIQRGPWAVPKGKFQGTMNNTILRGIVRDWKQSQALSGLQHSMDLAAYIRKRIDMIKWENQGTTFEEVLGDALKLDTRYMFLHFLTRSDMHSDVNVDGLSGHIGENYLLRDNLV